MALSAQEKELLRQILMSPALRTYAGMPELLSMLTNLPEVAEGVGTQGPQGDPGPTGPQGPQGPVGNAGPQGPKGDTGATGPQGLTGSQGSQGPQGIPGSPGATGSAGPQGIKGDIGSTGPQGPTGPAGADSTVPGPQGIQGIPGVQGPAGVAPGGVIRKTAAQTLTLTAQTAIADASFAVAANSKYYFVMGVRVTTSTGTSPTTAYGFTGPAGATIAITAEQDISTSVEQKALITAFGNFTAGAQVANTGAEFKGVVETGGTAGIVQLTCARAGTTPSMIIPIGGVVGYWIKLV